MLLRILRPYLDFEKGKDYEVATEAAKYMISMRIAKEVVSLDELTNENVNSTPAEDFVDNDEPETVEPETVEPETVEPETVEPETVAKKSKNKLKVDAVNSIDDILGFKD